MNFLPSVWNYNMKQVKSSSFLFSLKSKHLSILFFSPYFTEKMEVSEYNSFNIQANQHHQHPHLFSPLLILSVSPYFPSIFSIIYRSCYALVLLYLNISNQHFKIPKSPFSLRLTLCHSTFLSLSNHYTPPLTPCSVHSNLLISAII